MVRKLFCAMVVMTISVGFVMASEYTAVVTAVKDGKVTLQKYQKTKKGEEKKKDGEAFTLPITDDATIAKAGKYNKEDKKFEVGDKIENGLKNEMFTKIGEKGVTARITTDADDKKVTQILVIARKK